MMIIAVSLQSLLKMDGDTHRNVRDIHDRCGEVAIYFYINFFRNYEVWITLYQPNISTDIRFIRILTFIDYKYVEGYNILTQFNPPTSPEGYHEL